MNKIAIFFIISIFCLSINQELLAKSSFSSQRIEAACKNFLASKLSGDIKVDFVNNIVDLEFLEDGVEAYFELTGAQIGISSIKIHFFKNNADIRKVIVPIKIYQKQRVPVAQSNLKLGEEITDLNIKFEYKLVDFIAIYNEEFLIGSITKRAFQSGEILNQDYLDLPPVIKKGDEIKVNVQTASVIISTSGKALNDAKIGESINVQREGAKKIISGFALQDGTVLVQK